MRRIERFLIAFAVLSVAVGAVNRTEGILLVTCALPALAAFYLFGACFLLKSDKYGSIHEIMLAVISGIGFAYCFLSLLSLFLRWIRMPDLLENTLLITGILSLIGGAGYWRTGSGVYKSVLQRAVFMMAVFILVGITYRYWS